jgi:hypothetical protein
VTDNMSGDDEVIARIRAQYPACRVCGNPCVAGQKDAQGRPCHLSCGGVTASRTQDGRDAR